MARRSTHAAQHAHAHRQHNCSSAAHGHHAIRTVAGTLQHKLPGVTLATSKDQRVGVTTFRPVLSAPLPPPPPPPPQPQPPPAPPLGSALATPPKALKPPPQQAAPQPSLPLPPPQTPPLSTAEPAGDIEVTVTLNRTVTLTVTITLTPILPLTLTLSLTITLTLTLTRSRLRAERWPRSSACARYPP